MENHKQKPLPPLSLFPQEPSKKHCMVNQGKVFNPRSIHGNCVPLTVQTLWGKLPEGKMCIYIYYLYINVCVCMYIYINKIIGFNDYFPFIFCPSKLSPWAWWFKPQQLCTLWKPCCSHQINKHVQKVMQILDEPNSPLTVWIYPSTPAEQKRRTLDQEYSDRNRIHARTQTTQVPRIKLTGLFQYHRTSNVILMATSPKMSTDSNTV